MSADDRDWYRERAKKTMRDHYYKPMDFRGSREVRSAPQGLAILKVFIAVGLPWAFLVVAGAIWLIAHGANLQDAIVTTSRWTKGFLLSHPSLWLILVFGSAFYMASPRIAGVVYACIGIVFLSFLASNRFGPKPVATANPKLDVGR
jgi:aspartyl protease family protein